MNTQTNLKNYIHNVCIEPRNYTNGSTKLLSLFKIDIAGIALNVDFDFLSGSINNVCFTRDYSYSPVLTEVAFPIDGEFIYLDQLIIKMIDLVKADFLVKDREEIKGDIEELSKRQNNMHGQYNAMPWDEYNNTTHQIAAMQKQAAALKLLEGVA